MTAPATAPPADDEQPLLDLDGLVAGIRWRRRMWTVFALVGLALGVAASTVLPSRASADASIYVIHESEGSGDGQSLMKTDLALLQTTTVAAVALETLKLPTTPEKYVATYSGTVAADNILTVTVRAPDDAQALAGAQAVADAFITVHIRQSTDAANANVKAYNDRQDQVQRDLDDINRQIADAGLAAPAELQALYNRRSSLASQISSLQQQAQAASIGSPQVAAGTKIIDTPHRTSRSLLVSVALYGGIGLGLGLAIGLVFAAVAAVARSRPLLRRDIAKHLGASVIAQVPAPLRGPRRFVRRSHADKERRRAATTLARVVRDGSGPVSVLELGCPKVAAELVKDMAEELVEERPVTVVDDLPGNEMSTVMAAAPESAVELVAGADFPPATAPETDTRARRLAIATVGPGSPWPDLRRLAAESLLVVRAGSADAAWLHTVARQLADAGILVLGVVVVHPDPRDRSDGTLWDATHMALRGRNTVRVLVPAAPWPVRPDVEDATVGLSIPAPRRGPNGRGPLRPIARPAAPTADHSTPTQVLPIAPAPRPVTRASNGAAANAAVGDGAAAQEVVAPEAAANGAAANGRAAANGAAANGAAANGAAANGAAANGAAANGAAANGAAANGAAANGAAANGAAANGAAAKGRAANGVAANGAAANGAAPNATPANGHAANGTAANGHAPNGTAPNGTAPNGTAANGTAANGTAANGAAAHGTAANGMAPHGHAPNGTAANGTAPHGTVAGGPAGDGATPRPRPQGANAGTPSSDSPHVDGVRGTNGSTAVRKPSPRPLSGRRPSPRPHGGSDSPKPRPRPGGPDIQATDKFQPVVPSTPADHVEAT